MFLAQMGEASTLEFMKVRHFPLSLTGTAFAWFTSLPSCSIGSWAELEEKFYNHFYNGAHELDCLISHRIVKGVMSPSLIFFKRFREIKNRCFHLMIFERDLTDLCFAGLRPNIREKLEHYEFVNVNQLLQKVVSVESRLKESHDAYRSHHPNVHVIDGYFDSSDDENKNPMLLKLDG